MKILLLVYSTLVTVSVWAQRGTSNNHFCQEAAKESLTPIRAGSNEQPFWNEKAKMFKHVPSFANHRAIEIKPIRFRYSAFSFANKRSYTFTAGSGTETLSPIWEQIPTGNVYLKIEGISAEGYIALVEDRMFYKAATFCPPYPAARYSYKTALLKGLQYLYDQPFIRQWYVQDYPDHHAMQFYCYSSKVVGAVIDAMLLYDKYFPSDSAILIARKAADYLIKEAELAGAPLEYFPQTYEGENLTAREFKNEILMTEPAWTAGSYLDLYERTNEKKYYDAAIRIADTYVASQLPSGTWYTRVDKRTGKPTASALCIPNNIITLFSRLANRYQLSQYRENCQSAEQWIMENPIKTFNWEGQFEDVGVAQQYQNLTHFEPARVAMRLLDSTADKAKSLAAELIAFCEDQFIVWEKPDLYDDRNTLANEWAAPAALEQYHCFLPIDGSTDHMIFLFCKAYDKTANPIFLAKATALANTIVNCQWENGRIPTFLYPLRKQNFWPNCMVYSLQMLEKMSSY